MTPTERGLLADIIANPDDDTPRLVFADWLEDNGDPHWAELIRLQLHRDDADWSSLTAGELADHLEACRRRKMREGSLRAVAGSRLKIKAMSVLWERGFVYSLTASLGEWTEHGPAIAARHPLRSVWLTDRSPRPVRSNPWGHTVRYYYTRSDGGEDHHLPPAVFDRLGGEQAREPHPFTLATLTGDPIVWFPTEDDANAALSKALISWARAEWEGTE